MAVISLELLKYVKQIVNVNKVSLILFFFLHEKLHIFLMFRFEIDN